MGQVNRGHSETRREKGGVGEREEGRGGIREREEGRGRGKREGGRRRGGAAREGLKTCGTTVQREFPNAAPPKPRF